MSWLWILIWFVLSAILLGATAWSFQILMRQKRAWSAFAKKYKLSYVPGKMMASPSMSGVIGEYRVSFFTGEQQAPDVRNRRFRTVVEIMFPEGLVNGAAAGTPEMMPFIQSLTLLHPYAVEVPGWDANHKIHVKDDDIIKAFLTPERLDHLGQILKTRNADVLVLFDDKEALVRLESADPLQDPAKIEKLVKGVVAHADKLRLVKASQPATEAK